MLSGEQIVAKSIKKVEATLPESGLKDVAPNGSWLEQKQIQAALESRKHLIEIERIEKGGSLSHAKWRDDIQLAEVTQKLGCHWHHIGHNVGKTLFIKPEEALFLIESNCLQVQHNGVTVSLQKAYSLLLCDSESLNQYKVYASLSRLGYKVIRHKVIKKNIMEKDGGCTNGIEVNDIKETNTEDTADSETKGPEMEDKMDCDVSASHMLADSGVFTMDEVTQENTEKTECGVKTNEFTLMPDICQETINSAVSSQQDNTNLEDTTFNKYDFNIADSHKTFYVTKLEKLCKRQLSLTDSKLLFKHFESVPDLFQKQVFTVNAPDQELVPKNVFVNKSSYTLSLQNIRVKRVRPVSTESVTYSTTDEVNGDHVRRIRNISGGDVPNAYTFATPRFPRQNLNFRPYNFWRPQNSPNYYQFNMFYQRPYFPNMFFMPRYQCNPNPNPTRPPFNNNTNNSSNTRKRTINKLKSSQLRGIKTLAVKLKQLFMSGNTHVHNIQALHRLLSSYNMKYKTRLRLTSTFEVINDEVIIDTIELDDDEESKSKKPRLDEHDNLLDENLDRLRQLAFKLKDLEAKHKASARHRRAFSNALKTFNKSYDSDYYLSSNYEVLDRRYINLESSSDSDCIVAEPKNNKRKKMLRNPFSMMKNLSRKNDIGNMPSTSKEDNHDDHTTHITKYNEYLIKTFDKSWLPNEDDFGRAEIVPKLQKHKDFSCGKEEYLYDFMNEHNKKFNSWIDAKISFMKRLQDANIAFQHNELQNNVQAASYTGLRPLIGPDDRVGTSAVLEKLRIIKNNKDMNTQTSLKIVFDVYNRNVQNFKKTNPPKPHFRIICIHESSSFPSASDLLALHSNYDDNVAIVLAIVSVSSVSYLQVNPTDTPIYIPINDLV